MSIYKFQTEFSPSLKSIEGQRTKSSSIQRCIIEECKILFETSKRYKKRVCLICRYNQRNEEFKRKCDEEWNFDQDKYIAKAKKLEIERLRFLKAKDVKLTNQVKPKRFEILGI